MCEYKGVNGKNLTIVDENGVVEFKIKKEFVQIDQKTLDEIIRQMNRIKVTNEPFYAQVYGEWVKRKPLPDNSLPLTKEELKEFSKITGLGIILVELIADSIYISYRTETGEEENGYVTDVKAILWLADRFELSSNN